MNVKDKLLSTKLFNVCDELDLYCTLIEQNKDRPKERYKTQVHHVVPQCWYNYHKLPVDNTLENTVNLLYKDHILAHYYLACSCAEPKMRAGMIIAVHTLLGVLHHDDPLDTTLLENILPDLDKYQLLYESGMKLQAERCKKLHTGRKRSEDTCRKISEGQKGKVVTIESRKKMSDAKKGRVMSDEQKQKISNSMKGKPKSWKGRKQTLEEIENRRQKLLGRKPSLETRNKISVALTGIKRSEETRRKVSEAGRGRVPWNKGKESTIKGKICIYKESTIQYIDKEQLDAYIKQGWQRGNPKSSKAAIGRESKNKRKVKCIETGYIFDSVQEASMWCHGSVVDAAKGRYKTAGGYHWEYVD